MVKKQGEETEVEIDVTQLPEAEIEAEPEEAITQPKTYTQEELDVLRAEAMEQGRAEALEKYQGIQRGIAIKEKRIKELERRLARPQTSADRRVMSGMLEELDRQAKEAYGSDPEAQSRIARLRGQLLEEEQMQARQTYTQQWRGKLDQKIKEAGFDPSSDMFADVDEAFDVAYAIDGKFERAERKLDRILKATPKKEIKPTIEGKPKPETEDERIARKAKELLIKQGLIPTGASGPSVSSSDAEFIKQFGSGELPASKANMERYNKIVKSY